jgi:DNA-binding transcriptional LysR family regulator
MRLDLAKLHVFREVARAGSVGAAARRLHVTASAVSHALARLRESVAHDLFELRGRRLSLTPAGEELAAVCQHVFDDLEAADARLGAAGASFARRLALGSTVEFGTTVLLPRLQPLLARHPELHVDFHFAHELLPPLLRDELDLVVDCRAHDHPAVHRAPLFREKYVLVAAPAFLAAHRVRAPRDLARVPVLSHDRDGMWWNRLTSALPAAQRPRLARLVVVDNVRGMINAAAAGYGVGLVPKYAVLGELERGALFVLFPRLALLDDTFAVYQKVTRVEREAHGLITRFLLELDLRALGDAIRVEA